MNQPKRFLITAALPYANGPLHIGHIAGAYLPADIYVRYLKANHKDAVFVCGSDEHGAAITLRARKDGKQPQEIVDYYHQLMKQAFADFGIQFDVYHRTSAPEHHEMSQGVFKQLLEKGMFEVETSHQYYDPEAKQFLADRYITGTCPKCSNDRAYGDQCEKCGSALSPLELIDPKSTLTGSAPVLKETSHWYLPMANHEGWIKSFIQDGVLDGVQHHVTKEWKAHVLGQCMSWIDGGLQSRAMTRDLDWGVPVPVEGADGKVLYVWMDAPIGYITNTKVWADANGKNWEDYWKSPDSRLIHFIGKDNIVFHCIIFPIILKAHGEFVLPYNVPANEFMNLEGDKISTSRNWAVWLHEYMQEFPGKQDEMRYVLCSIMPEQKDSEFTWTDFKDRVNNELADILGNLVNRVFVLNNKYYNGILPDITSYEPDELDKEVLLGLEQSFRAVGEKIESFRFREALAEAMQLARWGNKYLTETEPWKLQKTNPERTAFIMFQCAQIIAKLSIAIEPFLPFTAAKLKQALHAPEWSWQDGENKVLLPPGHTIGNLGILFEKITDEQVAVQVEKLQQAKAQSQAVVEGAKENITFEQFQGMDLRMVKVIEAEQVPKTKKLLKLKVDTGFDQRTVISGIAEHYKPEDILGKTVLMLVNLAPREIKGVESQGMILMAENAQGQLTALVPDRNAEPGNIVA
ncbi:MAG: methionine--tRNA ligase [Bacteroidota bacterium]